MLSTYNKAFDNIDFYGFLKGLNRFKESESNFPKIHESVVKKFGSSKLLYYHHPNPQNIIFVIPSLINRYYILDLNFKKSLIKYLNQNNSVYLIAWDEPNKEEESYDISDYYQQIISPAFEFVREIARDKLVVLGHCQGAVMSLFLCSQMQEYIKGLLLISCPWDLKHLAVDSDLFQKSLHGFFENNIKVSPKDIETFFTLNDYEKYMQKFCYFANVKEESEEYKNFLAIENWIKSGISLTKNVAKEILYEWPVNNHLEQDKFVIAGKKIAFDQITCKILLNISTNDKLVPPSSTFKLIKKLKYYQVVNLETGHIGSVISKEAQTRFWPVIRNWLTELAA